MVLEKASEPFITKPFKLLLLINQSFDAEETYLLCLFITNSIAAHTALVFG